MVPNYQKIFQYRDHQSQIGGVRRWMLAFQSLFLVTFIWIGITFLFQVQFARKLRQLSEHSQSLGTLAASFERFAEELSELNSPGNDVFESEDISLAKTRYESTRLRILDTLELVESQLKFEDMNLKKDNTSV
jgi:biopolymer transport protein ExbB/TolQ